ncbi:MAG: amidohydrolase family protein [candidate division WS1 bacterium]|jgi:predicted TIM-barrel fold metal-dependent hydrolase|nr:amidohydrolase family protein [candidate division WS1 bacterium]
MITYFDSCAYLGRHGRMREGMPVTPEALLAEMDHYGIHEALVLDALAVEVNPRAGNQRLLEFTRPHPRLHPAWVGLLPTSHELLPPEELVARMREAGVGALYLFYQQYSLPLEDWALESLLEPLEEASVPVFLCPNRALGVWRDDETPWGDVVRLCRRFPRLPVVATEYRVYGGLRAAYSAMSLCPNLHLDLTSWWLHKSLEFLVQEFGAERIVWSSQLPVRCPGSPLMQLNYSDLTPDQLALIAGGNLRRLLSWNENVTPAPPVNFPPALDRLHEATRARQSLRELEFYDCHGHFGGATPRHVIKDTPADVVRELDKFGVRQVCVFTLEGVGGDEVYGNDRIAELVAQYPDRFVGFTLVNPHRGERMMLEELERGRERGMRGIKLIPHYQGYPEEGPLVDVPCRYADEHGLFLLNHSWGSAKQMERLCATYPRACFITGHSTTEYVEVAQRHPNLYICTCPLHNYNQAEEFVELYGADRLLFGSDLLDLPIAWGMGQIMYARLPEADKRKILGENLQRLLAEYAPLPGP